MKRRIVWWILTIACAASILVLSCQSVSSSIRLSGTITNAVLEQNTEYQEMPPAQQTVKNDYVHDYLRRGAHVLVFVALAFCASRLVCTYTAKWWALITAPICMAFAVLDECVQHLRNVGRSFEWSDIYRDWLGIAIGIGIAAAVSIIVWVYQRIKQGARNDGVSGTGAG